MAPEGGMWRGQKFFLPVCSVCISLSECFFHKNIVNIRAEPEEILHNSPQCFHIPRQVQILSFHPWQSAGLLQDSLSSAGTQWLTVRRAWHYAPCAALHHTCGWQVPAWTCTQLSQCREHADDTRGPSSRCCFLWHASRRSANPVYEWCHGHYISNNSSYSQVKENLLTQVLLLLIKENL